MPTEPAHQEVAAAGLWQRMMEHAISAAATVPEFIEAPDDDSDEGEDARLSANSAASLAANGEEDGSAEAEAAEAAEEPVPSAPRPPAIVPGSSLEAPGVSQPTASAVARAVFAVLSAQETDTKDDFTGGGTPPLSDSGPSPPPLQTAGGSSPSGPSSPA